MTFVRVKEILVKAIAAWSAKRNGRAPKLAQKHGPTFPKLITGEFDRAFLLQAQATGILLIQPEVIGNGRGSEANLVKVLRTGLPEPDNIDQMPFGGPAVPEDEIKEIEAWIDAGCPE